MVSDFKSLHLFCCPNLGQRCIYTLSKKATWQIVTSSQNSNLITIFHTINGYVNGFQAKT